LGLLAPGLASPARADEETWEKAFSLEGVTRVSVSNVNGPVEARTWDRDYVRVTAVKSGSSRRVKETQIRTSQRGDEIKIETVTTHRHHSFFGTLFGGSDLAHVSYQLFLPAETQLSLTTVNGSVEAEDRKGRLRVETVNGHAEVRRSGGEARVETVNGRIKFTALAPLSDTRLETVNGSIDADIPDGTALHYRLETINGSLEAGDSHYHGHSFGSKEMEGDLNGGGPRFSAETVNGSIRLAFAKP
jgi:hypothetical protein